MGRRYFADKDGLTWIAYDVVSPVNRRRSGAPMPAIGTDVHALYEAWLCFESETKEKRRLGVIPEGWENLPEAELQRLLQEAKPQ